MSSPAPDEVQNVAIARVCPRSTRTCDALLFRREQPPAALHASGFELDEQCFIHFDWLENFDFLQTSLVVNGFGRLPIPRRPA